jgi:hypothetical protein
MKRQIVGMLVAVGLIAAVQAVPRSMPQNSNPEDAVSQLVQVWLNAESQGDSTTLNKLIADDFLGTGPGGNILDKSDIIPPAGEERPKMPKSHVKESTLRLFGNTAVVVGSVAYETLSQPGLIHSRFPEPGAGMAGRRRLRSVESAISRRDLSGNEAGALRRTLGCPSGALRASNTEVCASPPVSSRYMGSPRIGAPVRFRSEQDSSPAVVGPE